MLNSFWVWTIFFLSLILIGLSLLIDVAKDLFSRGIKQKGLPVHMRNSKFTPPTLGKEVSFMNNSINTSDKSTNFPGFMQSSYSYSNSPSPTYNQFLEPNRYNSQFNNYSPSLPSQAHTNLYHQEESLSPLLQANQVHTAAASKSYYNDELILNPPSLQLGVPSHDVDGNYNTEDLELYQQLRLNNSRAQHDAYKRKANIKVYK
ncbi:hypothetical protein HDU92_005691 [Lobulomyces angularis]|nr:hypothetical protein HDU92_005691 [Lobulomyces angularis]